MRPDLYRHPGIVRTRTRLVVAMGAVLAVSILIWGWLWCGVIFIEWVGRWMGWWR